MPDSPTATAALLPCRCVLFVPGDRPDRYPKALATAADRVCIDLEDAVAPARKEEARAAVGELLRDPAWDAARSIVRINHPGTPEGRADLGVLAEAPRAAGPASPGAAGPGRPVAALTLMVPKCASPTDLDVVQEVFAVASAPAPVLVPVVETASGLAAVEHLACRPGVAALLLGGVDLTAELGAALEWDALLYARSRVVHAAALGRVPALDVPFLDTADADGLRAEAERVSRLGFGGKVAVHPVQVDVLQRAFSPSEEDVAHAEGVLLAASGREGAFLHEGRMVDRPVVEAARRTLARAGRAP